MLSVGEYNACVTSYDLIVVRPESNMLKILPKMLSGISQNFHLLCFSGVLIMFLS